jgi:hypothetical protein
LNCHVVGNELLGNSCGKYGSIMRQVKVLWNWWLRLVLYVFIAPATVHALIWSAHGGPSSWRDADWSSAGILPSPESMQEATIRVYSARTGGWKGAIATHSWLVVKRQGAPAYDRYDVVGWGNPVRKNDYPPDGRWYSNEPQLTFSLDGPLAQKLIPRLEAAIASYRWSKPGDYAIWPGPNSNTFVATVLAALPELDARLPSTAVGRDYPADGRWFALTSSGGVRLSAGGYLGLVAGSKEGIELNFLGLVAGIDVLNPGLEIPGFGRIAP